MRVLILGGTQFVGRHIAEAMVAGGHCVSTLNRGRTTDELPASVERLRGDRDAGAAGLDALRGRTWDACIDVSGYTPRQVRPSAQLLGANVGRYVFVSAVAVYGDPDLGPVFEAHPRLPPAGPDVAAPVSNETYGALKVACEDLVRDVYGDRCTILRPQIVVGPYEPGSRFAYWVWRAAQGGRMLAPGGGSDFLQVIDGRDVARFTRTVVHNDLAGVFNLSGDRLTWARFMDVLGATDLARVPADVLKSAGVDEHELPLYRRTGGPRSRLMHVSNVLALAAGLKLTGLAVTVEDTRRWLAGKEMTPALSPERELELIATARLRAAARATSRSPESHQL